MKKPTKTMKERTKRMKLKKALLKMSGGGNSHRRGCW